MPVKWEKQEGNEGILTVEVSAEKFNEALDEAFKKVVKDVEMPGFRKGRIPRSIFEKRFGVEALYQDALDIVLPEAYMKAIDETGIEPVSQPEIDIEEIGKDQELVFTAKVTVKPEVKLGEYKGLEIEDKNVEITEEDVTESIEIQRQQLAELVLKEEGSVEEGDTVVIDFEGFHNGEPFEGGKAENHSLEIGSGSFIPGFEEQLVGKTQGEEFEIKVTFPEDYHQEELAGEDTVFKIKIHEIKYKELPELDDEFAKDVDDEVETLEELREKIKKDLKEQKEVEIDNENRQKLINQVTENAEIDVPDVMVENELEQMMNEFEQRLQMQGMDLNLYTQFSGQSEDELKEQMKEDALKRIKTHLTLEAIVEKEQIEVTEEDIEKELEKMAEMYNIETEQIKEMLGGNTEALKGDLRLQKAIDYLLEQSKVV